MSAKIQSPCIDECSLDSRGICKGCGRSSREIVEWVSYTGKQRRDIMQRLKNWRNDEAASKKNS